MAQQWHDTVRVSKHIWAHHWTLRKFIFVCQLTNMSHAWSVNSLRPRQNGRLFADNTFKRIFLNENIRISIEISLKFVPKGPINNIPALVQIMAWRRSGGKPLSEPMMVILLTHICRPQWVNSPGQNGRHLLHLFLRAQLTITQHWFR